MTSTDRDLIQRLADALQPCVTAEDESIGTKGYYSQKQQLIDKARARLAQPEPEGPPTDAYRSAVGSLLKALDKVQDWVGTRVGDAIDAIDAIESARLAQVEPECHLPGKFGHWIDGSNLLPTVEDADEIGDIHIRYNGGPAYINWQSITVMDKWRPFPDQDPRPKV